MGLGFLTAKRISKNNLATEITENPEKNTVKKE
jgi:hypothetical protein